MCPVQAKNTEKHTREHSRVILNFPGEQSYPEGRSQGQGFSSAFCYQGRLDECPSAVETIRVEKKVWVMKL